MNSMVMFHSCVNGRVHDHMDTKGQPFDAAPVKFGDSEVIPESFEMLREPGHQSDLLGKRI